MGCAEKQSHSPLSLICARSLLLMAANFSALLSSTTQSNPFVAHATAAEPEIQIYSAVVDALHTVSHHDHMQWSWHEQGSH